MESADERAEKTAEAAETEKKTMAMQEIQDKILSKEQHVEKIKERIAELRKDTSPAAVTQLKQLQVELEEQATLITALQINLVTMEERQRTRALRGYLFLKKTTSVGTSFKKFYCVAEYPFFRY